MYKSTHRKKNNTSNLCAESAFLYLAAKATNQPKLADNGNTEKKILIMSQVLLKVFLQSIAKIIIFLKSLLKCN